MKKLTLIIPAKYERESLPIVLEQLKNYEFKINVILQKDDIATIESIKNFNIDIIYQDQLGYGNALIVGINNLNTDYFCIFNADGSFDSSEISKMLNIVKNSDIDFVFGSRYQKGSGSDDDTAITFIGNKIFTFLGKIMFGLPITDILYTFVVGKSVKVKQLNLLQTDFSFCVELPIKAKKLNMSMQSTKSYERKRIAGKKKVNAIKDGFFILISMLKFFIKK
jgi:glycosyltransferase involved in cell wall biosynthesis